MNRFRGNGKDLEEWYSICSRHRNYDNMCGMCKIGDWINVRRQQREALFYRFFPWLWRWWANRPSSPRRKRLEEIFPGLKNDGRYNMTNSLTHSSNTLENKPWP